MYAQTFDGQRAMLDKLAELTRAGQRPSVTELGNLLGVSNATARRCLLWLQAEGFVRLSYPSASRAVVELTRYPDDEALRAAVAGRRADL